MRNVSVVRQALAGYREKEEIMKQAVDANDKRKVTRGSFHWEALCALKPVIVCLMKK